jgi:hypothetical protein
LGQLLRINAIGFPDALFIGRWHIGWVDDDRFNSEVVQGALDPESAISSLVNAPVMRAWKMLIYVADQKIRIWILREDLP